MGPRPLLELFGGLDEAAVRWALLRGADRLDDRTGDVDLLVDGASLDGLHRAALEAGFVRWRAWRGAGQYPYTALDSDCGGWVSLHATDRLAFGPRHEVPTTAADAVLDRRVLEGACWVLRAEDELWVTLLHAVLDKGGVAGKHHDRLRALARSVDRTTTVASPVPAALTAVIGAWPAADLAAAVAAGRWDEVAELGGALQRAALGNARRRVQRALRTAVVVGFRLREARAEPGTVVALLAPDGAGKSTLAEGLQSEFAVPVRTVYLGLHGRAGPLDGRRLPPGLGMAVRLAWLLGRRSLVAVYRARRWVVILDRHPLDALAVGAPTGRWGRARRRILIRAAPRPDLVLVLDADGDELHRRKGEHDPATLAAAAAGYLTLAAARDDAVVLDASAPAEEVRRRAVEAIWERQMARARALG